MNLKRERLRKGLSQRELADILGVSRGTVCVWESGNNGRVPWARHIKKMKELFGDQNISYDDFLFKDKARQ